MKVNTKTIAEQGGDLHHSMGSFFLFWLGIFATVLALVRSSVALFCLLVSM